MVSKARLDLPEPDRPVITTSLSRGISTDIFLRLCTRAPFTAMVVRATVLAVAMPVLEFIRLFPQVDERELLHQNVALLREVHGRGGLADEPPVRQVPTRRGHAFHVPVPLAPRLDLGR